MTKIRTPGETTPPSSARLTPGLRQPAGGASRTGRGGNSAAKGAETVVAPTPLPALQRVRETFERKPGDTRAQLRSIIEPSLVRTLGPDATADPAFFGLVDAVVDALQASPEAMKLLEEARAQLKT